MLNNFKKQSTIYYLVEVNESNGELHANPLAKQWNSNAFMVVSSIEQAHKFTDKEAAQKMCKLQNLLSEGFGSRNITYVVEGVTQNTLYDENGETKEPESFTVQNDE